MPGGIQAETAGGTIEDAAVTDLLLLVLKTTINTNQQSCNCRTSHQATDVNFLYFLHLRPRLDINGLCLSLFYNAKVKIYVLFVLLLLSQNANKIVNDYLTLFVYSTVIFPHS